MVFRVLFDSSQCIAGCLLVVGFLMTIEVSYWFESSKNQVLGINRIFHVN
jgi:hypothetical protein